MEARQVKRFDIDPHVIRQLGEELVPDEMTALVELVKNAYDADADYVKININTRKQYTEEKLVYPNHNGYIIVEDSGFGMDEETIIKSWLTISYSNKRAGKDGLKKKTIKERTPLGDKGLGRLSTQRLADHCEIFTTAEGSNERLHVAFDWRDFDSVNQLSKVPVVFNSYKSEQKGTKLVLTNLHSPSVWTGARLESFKDQIVQVLSPFAEVRKFYVFLQVDGETIDVMQKFDSILSLAIASYVFSFNGDTLTVSGSIKPQKLCTGNRRDILDNYRSYIEQDNGKKFINYFFEQKKKDSSLFLSKNGFIGFQKTFSLLNDMSGLIIVNGEICNPGPFEGRIYDFALSDNDFIDSKTGFFNSASEYKEYIKNQSGIKIYRDGFAVLPYGFKDDDWLGLRKGQTSGGSFYGLRPGNTLGYFAISEGDNVHLKDKTDRTGFISNEFSTNFNTIARTYICDVCNSFVESVRRSYNAFIKNNKQTNTRIKTLNDAYNQIRSTAEASLTYSAQIKEVKDEIKKASVTSNQIIKDNDSIFNSERSDDAISVLKNASQVLNRASDLLSNVEAIIEKADMLSTSVDFIEPMIQTLEQQLDDFSSLAAVGMTAESITHEFPNLIQRLTEANTDFKKKISQRDLDVNFCGDFSRLVSIITNAMTVQLRHVSPALRYARESKDSFDILSFLNDQNNQYYQSSLGKDGISLQLFCNNPFLIEINKGRLIQVLDNLINNSTYWLRERMKKELFSPNITIIIDKPWLYLFDNGWGITPSIEESIFDPFVTTKPKGQGRGLGLFIVRQLLDAVGCSIVLDEKRNEFDRRNTFSINFANIII